MELGVIGCPHSSLPSEAMFRPLTGESLSVLLRRKQQKLHRNHFHFLACAAIRLARFNVLSSTDDGAPSVPGKYILGLPSPPASGVLISLVVANHAMEGALSDPRYTIAIFVMTIFIALLMVSNVRFRSFKDLRLNTATIFLVTFVVTSSAFVWKELKPQFVLVWLLCFYVLIGVIETLKERFSKLQRGNS